MSEIQIGIVQLTYTSETPSLDYLADKIDQLSQQGAQLIILPELHKHRYFCQEENQDNFDLAEPIPGPTTAHFARLCKKLSVVLITSIFERRAPGLFHNTGVVIDSDGSIAGTYRKMHIPDDPGYYEKYYFAPGDKGFEPIKTSLGKIGVLICWDQWFPEAARKMALKGAEVIVYPTAIGWDPNDQSFDKEREINAWKTIQKAHSIANGVFVVAVNRVGFENDSSEQTNGIDFWGNSFVSDPFGNILYQASSSQQEFKVIKIDLNEIERTRKVWPFLRDRRIDHYNDLDKLNLED